MLPTRAAAQSPAQSAQTRKSIYESIGVRPLINARGTVTIVGASRTLPEVKRAMEDAARDYVQIDELMDGVGRRLAGLTGAEWGVVTSGASAALTAATVGCIAGGDPDKLAQLPNLQGLKDEVIIPRYSRTAYDHAVKAAGPRMVEVSDRPALESALGPRTAMILVLAGASSERGPLSLTEIAKLAKPHGVPILVDAAADGLAVPNPYLQQGADLVAYSGGKCLRGPQCAGLLIGRKDLVQAAWIGSAPHHGFGRGFKVGREEIMGMVAAVEMWTKRNHAEELRTWNGWLEHIAGRLKEVPGVTTDIRQPQGLSNPTPSLTVRWDNSAHSSDGRGGRAAALGWRTTHRRQRRRLVPAVSAQPGAQHPDRAVPARGGRGTDHRRARLHRPVKASAQRASDRRPGCRRRRPVGCRREIRVEHRKPIVFARAKGTRGGRHTPRQLRDARSRGHAAWPRHRVAQLLHAAGRPAQFHLQGDREC